MEWEQLTLSTFAHIITRIYGSESFELLTDVCSIRTGEEKWNTAILVSPDDGDKNRGEWRILINLAFYHLMCASHSNDQMFKVESRM